MSDSQTVSHAFPLRLGSFFADPMPLMIGRIQLSDCTIAALISVTGITDLGAVALIRDPSSTVALVVSFPVHQQSSLITHLRRMFAQLTGFLFLFIYQVYPVCIFSRTLPEA